MKFFGPNDKWVGRFGLTAWGFTLHFFPRVSVWGHAVFQDEGDDKIKWHTLGLGPIVALDWHEL